MEISNIGRFLNSLFDCSMDDVPMETLGGDFMREFSVNGMFSSCVSQKAVKTVKGCHKTLPQQCQKGATELFLSNKYQRECETGLDVVRNMSHDALQYFNKSEFIRSVTSRLGREMYVKKGALYGFSWYEQCVRQLGYIVDKCSTQWRLKHNCLRSSIRLMKVVRLNMDSVGEIVRRNPDIHVVFYLRDPRAIAKSVQQYPDIAMFGDKDTYRSELQYICVKMRRDLALYHILSVQYPGAFTRMKYENLVRNTRLISKRLHTFLSVNISEELSHHFLDWGESKTESGREKFFSTNRLNPQLTSIHWKKSMTSGDYTTANKYCVDVLSQLMYV